MSELEGKVILVTGATDGIGKQTALELAGMGGRVIVHGRSAERTQRAVEEIRKATGNQNVEGIVADLSSMRQVSELADEIASRCPRLNVLLHNAGTYMTERVLTEDGFETTFAVNHLAPFLLTQRLEHLLRTSAPARIITVSSIAHTRGRLDFDNLQGEKRFEAYAAYALSKLANVLFSTELAVRLDGSGVTSNSLHPGVIGTKLLRIGFNIGGASVEDGASASVYLASSPDVAGETGKYFVKKQAVDPNPLVLDASVRDRFWNTTESLLASL